MPSRSTHRNVQTTLALSQAAFAAVTPTAAYACQGFDAIRFAAIISAVGAAGGTLTLEVSDTVGGTFVAADVNDVLYSRTNAENNALVAGETTYASYVGIRAAVRAVVTPVTSATGSVICTVALPTLVPKNPSAV